MTNNASKMTLEERIVQTLKDDSLMKLVGDEDAITELVKRAIHEALFQPRKLNTYSYGGRQEEADAPIVKAAREAAERYANEAAKTLIEELLADPERKKVLHNAIVDSLPAAINMQAQYAVAGLVQQASMNAIEEIRRLKQSNML